MSIKKYRKKPVEIEALELTETILNKPVDIINFFNGQQVYHFTNTDDVIIETLEGDMTASPGDYIIKGVKGEFYPCKPDIFRLTYEEIDPVLDRQNIFMNFEGDITKFTIHEEMEKVSREHFGEKAGKELQKEIK